MSTIRQTSRTVRGFTLTEAAIVLGIVGLILSAIWVAAGSVYSNYRVGKTAEQLLSIVQSVRSLHSGVSQFPAAGDITLDLARAGGIPSDMIQRDAAGAVTGVQDIWSNAVVVQVEAGLTTFSVRFANMPRAACADLLVRNTGAGRDTGLVGAGNAGGIVAFPVPLATALGANGCNADPSALRFIFRLRG